MTALYALLWIVCAVGVFLLVDLALTKRHRARHYEIDLVGSAKVRKRRGH